MHAQHFVDNQTIHHVHRSSPFVFRSQVVYRHTDSVAVCERTPAFCVGRVPVWVTTESSERGTAPSRRASRRFPPAYIKDRKSGRHVLGRSSRRYRSR